MKISIRIRASRHIYHAPYSVSNVRDMAGCGSVSVNMAHATLSGVSEHAIGGGWAGYQTSIENASNASGYQACFSHMDGEM